MKSSLALALLLSVSAKAKELPPEIAAKLAKDGLVVIDQPLRQCFTPYLTSSRPAFVTSDSLLMAYSRLYEESVSRAALESVTAHLKVWPACWPKVAAGSLSKNPIDLEGFRRSRLMWATAQRLLTGKLPEGLDGGEAEAVELEAKRVESGTGNCPPGWLRPPDEKAPPFVSYTAFKPRSFYEGIGVLEHYYRFQKWLQEMPLDLSDEATISMAEHLGHALSEINDYRTLQDFRSLFPRETSLIALLLENSSWSTTPEKLDQWRKRLRGEFSERRDWRFMPPLVVLGSEAARELLPQGKAERTPEVMGAVFGNPVANKLLGQEFQKAVEGETGQLQETTTFRFLQDLNATPDPRAPALFRSEAWQRKQLNATLGYWAEYRYALQLSSREEAHYLPAIIKEPGFVEPYPAFFHHLAGQAQGWARKDLWKEKSPEAARLRTAIELEKTIVFLRDAKAETGKDGNSSENAAYEEVEKRSGFLDRLFPMQPSEIDDSDDRDWRSRETCLAVAKQAEELLAAYWQGDPVAAERLAPPADSKDDLTPRWWQLAATCFRLEAMAERQLAGQPWRDDDAQFLRDFGEHLGWLMFYEGNSYFVPLDDAPRIARYATLDSPAGATVYHAAAARPRPILIQYPDRDGKPVLCEGAVYAFRNVEAKQTPTRAEWIKDAEKSPWPAWSSGLVVSPKSGD